MQKNFVNGMQKLEKRAPLMKNRRFIDYIQIVDFQDKILRAFPYMHELEVSRFIQLVFHEITNVLHEKKSIQIPFFGRFYPKPCKLYKLYRRDIWNGYGEWITLDKPIDDWIVSFEPSPYLSHLGTHRYTQMAKDDVEDSPVLNTTARWDKAYIKFKTRDVALRDCPYSLSTFGYTGYMYERLIKESVNAGETVRLTAKDGEVYQIQEEDGNFDEKFRDAYNKTKEYRDLVVKRHIHTLYKRNHLKKVWNTTYSNFLHHERKEDMDIVRNTLKERRLRTNLPCFFFVLKFGYGFEVGEKRRVYSGYYFNNLENRNKSPKSPKRNSEKK